MSRTFNNFKDSFNSFFGESMLFSAMKFGELLLN